jgi:hypothetical protein
MPSRYSAAMRRIVPNQPDLFTPRQPDPPEAVPERAPLDELADMLAMLRATDRIPWKTLPEGMALEYRALFLGGLAGEAGKKLASAILGETERLCSAAEQADLARAAAWRLGQGNGQQ